MSELGDEHLAKQVASFLAITNVAEKLSELCLALVVERSALKKLLVLAEKPLKEVQEEHRRSYPRAWNKLEEVGHSKLLIDAETLSGVTVAIDAIKEFRLKADKLTEELERQWSGPDKEVTGS